MAPFPSETGPEIKTVTPCPSGACLDPKTVTDLGKWVRDAIANHRDTKSCPYIKERSL